MMNSCFKVSDLYLQHIQQTLMLFLISLMIVFLIPELFMLLLLSKYILYDMFFFVQIDTTRGSAYQTWIDFNWHITHQVFTLLTLIILLLSRSVSLNYCTTVAQNIVQCRWICFLQNCRYMFMSCWSDSSLRFCFHAEAVEEYLGICFPNHHCYHYSPKTDCSSYRPITLLSVTGKVFAAVLLAQLQGPMS